MDGGGGAACGWSLIPSFIRLSTAVSDKTSGAGTLIIFKEASCTSLDLSRLYVTTAQTSSPLAGQNKQNFYKNGWQRCRDLVMWSSCWDQVWKENTNPASRFRFICVLLINRKAAHRQQVLCARRQKHLWFIKPADSCCLVKFILWLPLPSTLCPNEQAEAERRREAGNSCAIQSCPGLMCWTTI